MPPTDAPPHQRPPVQLAGSPPLDPYLRAYYEIRWRVCQTELHEIARVMGWQDRLPTRPDTR